jgi:prepilin-type N-terminal cleavage/methylation domain-containing protein
MRRTGFTLIELSIVLVIVGLLVGGVLVGRELIKAAQLRAVVREVESLKVAMNVFRVKYNAMAGDYEGAAETFGASVSGNGDGVISVYSSDGNFAMGDGDDGPEYLRIWQQLALAKLISGTYSGLPDTLPAYIPGTNIPPTRYGADGGYVVWDNKGNLGITYIPNAAEYTSTAFLMLGGKYGAGTSDIPFYAGLLTTMDAYNIDAKTDDGISYTGTTRAFTGTTSDVSAFYPGATGCSSPINAPDTVTGYKLTHLVTSCVMLFRM